MFEQPGLKYLNTEAPPPPLSVGLTDEWSCTSIPAIRLHFVERAYLNLTF